MSLNPRRAAHRFLATMTFVAIVSGAGCARSPDGPAEVAELTNTFPAVAAEKEQPTEASAYVRAALDAVRQDDYAGGVVALQTVREMPGLSAEQRRAAYDAMQALTTQLVERAAKGDAAAKAQLAAIERTRSQ